MKKLFASVMVGLTCSTAAFATTGQSLKCAFGFHIFNKDDPTATFPLFLAEVPLTDSGALTAEAGWTSALGGPTWPVPVAVKASLPGEKFNFTLDAGNDLQQISVSNSPLTSKMTGFDGVDLSAYVKATLVDSQVPDKPADGGCVIEDSSKPWPDIKASRL